MKPICHAEIDYNYSRPWMQEYFGYPFSAKVKRWFKQQRHRAQRRFNKREGHQSVG